MVAPMLPAIGKNILESGLSSLTRNTWYRSTWYRKHLATKHLATKQTALAPASCPHDALVSYRLFPNSEIRWPHSPSVSLRAIIRPPPQSQSYDPRMLPAPHTAEQQGCLRAHCDSDRFSTARERRCAKRRLGANGGYDQRPLAPPSRTGSSVTPLPSERDGTGRSTCNEAVLASEEKIISIAYGGLNSGAVGTRQA